MDPFILLALYASLGYLGGVALAAQTGVHYLHSGRPRQAAACFRLGASFYPGRRNRVLMRSNLLAALSILGDHEAANREWIRLRPCLRDAGPYAPLAAACYVASLYYQGRYREGLEVSGHPDACLAPADRASFMAQDGEALRLLNRSSCELALGHVEEAARSIAQAETLALQHQVMIQHLQMARARVAWRRGEAELAGRLVQGVETSGIPDVYKEELLLLQALLLALTGKPDEAERILDFHVQVSSPRGFLYRPMAEGAVAEARGDVEAALGHFRRALKSGQPAGEPALRGGRLAQALGDLSQARFFFQEADRTDPESCWATMARRALEGMKTPSPEPR
jgi:tetratricopeptide (TPR) repeat protein